MESLYLSGPITGVDDWRERFMAAHHYYSSIGWGVCNPVYISEVVERNVARPEWRDYLREDIRVLMNCGAVAMLPGWERSKGARLEHHIAEEFGMKVLFYEGGKE